MAKFAIEMEGRHRSEFHTIAGLVDHFQAHYGELIKIFRQKDRFDLMVKRLEMGISSTFIIGTQTVIRFEVINERVQNNHDV